MADKKTFIVGSYKNPEANIKANVLESYLWQTDNMLWESKKLASDIQTSLQEKAWLKLN